MHHNMQFCWESNTNISIKMQLNPVICYATTGASLLFYLDKCPQVFLVKWSATKNVENKQGYLKEFTVTVEQSGVSVCMWYRGAMTAAQIHFLPGTAELHIWKTFASNRLLTNWNKQTPIHCRLSFIDFPDGPVKLQGSGDDRRWFLNL